MKDINFNFKIDEATKEMLSQTTVWKTTLYNRPANTTTVFEEAILNLFEKYKNQLNKISQKYNHRS